MGMAIVTIIGALAAIVAAWIIVIQLIYQKRREDTRAVRDAIALINHAAELARRHHEGCGDPRAAWQYRWEFFCNLSVEMPHRTKAVQGALLGMWARIEPVFDTAMAVSPGMTPEEITTLEGELVGELIEALYGLTAKECLKELKAIPGEMKLPAFARTKAPPKGPVSSGTAAS